MKVLLVNTLYHPNMVGGAERSVQFLSESLVHAGHKVCVVTTSPQVGMSTRITNGVNVYYVGLKNVYWPFKKKGNSKFLKPLWHGFDMYNIAMARDVGRIIDREQPDILHTNNLAGFSVAVWREARDRGLAVVHTLRDYYLLCPRNSMFKENANCKAQCLGCRGLSVSKKRISSLVNAVVGISQFILGRHLEHGYFRDASIRTVIFNAFEKKGKAVKRQEGEKIVRFGYLGQLQPHKGVEIILQAQATLPSKLTQYWLAGAGPIEYVEALKDRYESPNICFMGFVNPKSLFEKIDVLLVPSLWHEPLSRTIFEAYAHGVPVVASNRGGIPEIIDEGKTGFLFDPDRQNSLTISMKRFVYEPDLVAKMRPAVLKKSKEFLPKKIVDQYEKVYRKTMSHSS